VIIVPLQVEHIHPKARSGSDCVSNLTLACRPCNQAKDKRFIQDFLAHDPAHRDKILAYARKPLKDAAVVNATRWALANALQATGGRTKFNRH
jgi:5-methylcytosine-specific restriction endonuclease McrA